METEGLKMGALRTEGKITIMQTAIAARGSDSRLSTRYKTENQMHSELAPNWVRIGSCVAVDEYKYLI